MDKNYKRLTIRLIIGALFIFASWWIVKCGCVNLKALTPAAVRDYLQSLGKFGWLAYIIAYALNTISVFPPIAVLSLSAGLAFGQARGALYLMAAALLGTSLTFMISRYFGRSLTQKLLKGKFKGFDEKLRDNGFTAVLFFRVIPIVPYEVLNYAAGLSGIKFKDYFLATFLGLIPGVAIAAFFGGSLADIRSFSDIFAPKFLAAAGLMLVVIAIPAIYRIMRRIKEKNR